MLEILTELLQASDFPEGRCWCRQNYPAGQVIVREGELADCFFLIEDGRVRVTERIELEDHRHIQPGMCDMYPGDLFGEFCLFDDGPRSASVQAVTDSQLVRIVYAPLRIWMERHPDLGYQVLKKLFAIQAKQLRQANKRVGNLLAWGLKTHGVDAFL